MLQLRPRVILAGFFRLAVCPDYPLWLRSRRVPRDVRRNGLPATARFPPARGVNPQTMTARAARPIPTLLPTDDPHVFALRIRCPTSRCSVNSHAHQSRPVPSNVLSIRSIDQPRPPGHPTSTCTPQPHSHRRLVNQSRTRRSLHQLAAGPLRQLSCPSRLPGEN